MRRPRRITHSFVEYMPERMEEDVLYISMPFATASHKCFCGCGSEVVTPISPTDWRLTYNGVSISLHPSIGNWGFKCRSHYYISDGKVIWAGAMSQAEIDMGRAHDRLAKAHYFAPTAGEPEVKSAEPRPEPPSNFWSRLRRWARF